MATWGKSPQARQWGTREHERRQTSLSMHYNSYVAVKLIMTDADMGDEDGSWIQKIAEHFHKDPKYFEEVFYRAWFKLMHQADMGLKKIIWRWDVPAEDLDLAGSRLTVDYTLTEAEIEELKSKFLLHSDLHRLNWSTPPGTAQELFVSDFGVEPTAHGLDLVRRMVGKATNPRDFQPHQVACISHEMDDSPQSASRDLIVPRVPPPSKGSARWQVRPCRRAL